jgi:valyl-tRNA synthetase
MEPRYDHKIAELKMQQWWLDNQVYSPAHNPGPQYSIDTPPPTVSGNLHIGHIFSYTQTDIIARYKRMHGYSVIYPFGFDDNGLPTERFVEKKVGRRAHTMSRSEFISLCLSETQEIETAFKKLWQRIGLSVHWEYYYTTISETVRRLSQASFLDLLHRGYIYRAHEPALYCTTCQTSVAQAELDSIETPSTFNTIVFKDQNDHVLPVATTRPELLFSCVALMYNPTDDRYQYLQGTQATVPLYGFQVPILADTQVLPDKGTGLVMCCTFGDTVDIEWYRKFNLPFKRSIGLDGTFIADIAIPNGPMLSGLKVAQARALTLQILQEQGALIEQKSIAHRVSVHERCKREIEYIVLPQWFVRILDFKKELLACADRVQWFPAFMKSRYINWVEHIGWDWCISRQRFYGIPFPIWHCAHCKTILCAQQHQLPIDPQEHAYQGTCSSCGSTDIVPDTDVMDTWNTSALTPYIVTELITNKFIVFGANVDPAKETLPLSMRPQAHDIIRTWAFYSISRAWMHNNTVPWHTIVISGHVLSGQQEKLSKSRSNATLSPEQLLEKYAADAIRYWTASAKLGQDIAFSDNQCVIGQKLITKLWNAFRFISMHCVQENIVPTAPTILGTVNEWILHTATICFTRYTHHFEEHEFSAALDVVEEFFWHSFCDNYLELIKDQLFKPEQYAVHEVPATRWTLYHLGLRILQLYAPFIPHITEYIYQDYYRNKQDTVSLHQTRFADIQKSYHYSESFHLLEQLLHVVAQVRKLKSEHTLSLKTELAHATLMGNNPLQLQPLERLLCGIINARVILYQQGTLEAPVLMQEHGSWHAKVTA